MRDLSSGMLKKEICVVKKLSPQKGNVAPFLWGIKFLICEFTSSHLFHHIQQILIAFYLVVTHMTGRNVVE